MVSPSARRRAARYLVEGQKCSINQACVALHLAKSTFYLQGRVKRSAGRLERRIIALSRKHPSYGYRLITELLRAEGWRVNRKRVQRVRRREELQVVSKVRKTKRQSGGKGERVRAQKPNEVWSYDFVHDRLENGSGLKLLTVLDEYTRECLGILVERSITAAGVVEFLEELMFERGAPEHVRSDNGPEFVAQGLKEWLARAGIQTQYIEPGSPWENGHVESFHGKLRVGCLNRELFGNCSGICWKPKCWSSSGAGSTMRNDRTVRWGIRRPGNLRDNSTRSSGLLRSPELRVEEMKTGKD